MQTGGQANLVIHVCMTEKSLVWHSAVDIPTSGMIIR